MSISSDSIAQSSLAAPTQPVAKLGGTASKRRIVAKQDEGLSPEPR